MNAARKLCTVFRTVINARDGYDDRNDDRRKETVCDGQTMCEVRDDARSTTNTIDKRDNERTYVDARSFTSRPMHRCFRRFNVSRKECS